MLSELLKRWYRISPGANLYRHAVYPQTHKKSGKQLAMSYQALWRLVKNADGEFETSVAWERLAPTLEYVHGYGCRLAQQRNLKNQQDANYIQAIYCGAYQIRVDDVRALVGFELEGIGKITCADVIHRIEENGEIAHSALLVKVDPPPQNASAVVGVYDRLWRASSGPIKHVCDGDAHYNPHPKDQLLIGPRGDYVDRRSHLTRLIQLAGFQFDRMILKAIGANRALAPN